MAWFRRRTTEETPPPEPSAEERSTISIAQYAAMWSGIGSVYTPMSVGPERALTHAASWACIDVLASSVSTTPVDVVSYQGSARRPVSPAPKLVAQPSMTVDQDVWLYQLVESMTTDGNGFGLITATDGMGRPTNIELIDPATALERKVVGGVPQVKVDGTVYRAWPFGDLFHVPGKMVRAGSPFGENVLTKAQATIGMALAAREYSGRTFGDNGLPIGRWKSDRDLTPEQAREIKQVLRSISAGSREPIVTGTGLEWESLAVDMEQTQFLDVMKFAIEEACRFFRVPPAMVYAATSGQSVTYANVSQADLGFLKWSVDPYMVRIERKLSSLLSRPQVVKFNRSAFLRMDAPTRTDVFSKRLADKTMTVNEVRAHEDEEPFEGDEFNQPGIPEAPSGGGNEPGPV